MIINYYDNLICTAYRSYDLTNETAKTIHKITLKHLETSNVEGVLRC